jgi:hydantoinase/carbamoylase family amidase
MPQVDTARFLKDLHDLRKIGAYRTGVHRPTYSAEDMESRRWLMDRMAECGLEPTMDGIGNVIGRHPGPGPKLLVGSHIETQNQAGWLDGALGVVAGVALARAGLPVDVAAWADEEGHYGGFIGSRSFIGELAEEEIDRLANRYHGKTLREALREAGLEGLPRTQLEPGRHKGFLELHIEQGTQLESAGLRVGVVTGIVAIWQWRLTIEGMQVPAARPWRSDAMPGSPPCGCWQCLMRECPLSAGRAAPGPAGGSRSIPARPPSSLAGRRCCSSSATSTRRCWSVWKPACAPACRRATGGNAAPPRLRR